MAPGDTKSERQRTAVYFALWPPCSLKKKTTSSRDDVTGLTGAPAFKPCEPSAGGSHGCVWGHQDMLASNLLLHNPPL